MEEILIGIDGGGTKTEYCVYELSTDKKHFFKLETTNYKNIGEEQTQQNFKKAFKEIFTQMNITKDDIRGIAYGASGYDTKADEVFYKSLFLNMGIPLTKVFICNDSDMVLLSTGLKPGICTAAGTGSIAVALDKNNNRYRAGGWGSLISDKGSGYWIGQKVLSDLLLHIDGIKNQEPVYSKIVAFLDPSDTKNIPGMISLMTTEEIASVAKIVIDFAPEDEYSKSIITNAAEHLVDLGISLLKKADIHQERDVTMLLTGSIFKSSLLKEIYISQFKARSQQNVIFVSSGERPSFSGAMLAKNMFAKIN